MKKKSVSLMNIFMCFCVVLIHITAYPVVNLEKDSIWFKAFFIANTFVRFCVPCFVFLSGYKLYNKYKGTKLELKKFYLSRLKKIVLPYVLCYCIYFWYFYSKKWIDVGTFFKGLVLRRLVCTILLYYLFNPAIFAISINSKTIWKEAVIAIIRKWNYYSFGKPNFFFWECTFNIFCMDYIFRFWNVFFKVWGKRSK